MMQCRPTRPLSRRRRNACGEQASSSRSAPTAGYARSYEGGEDPYSHEPVPDAVRVAHLGVDLMVRLPPRWPDQSGGQLSSLPHEAHLAEETVTVS